MGILFCLMLLLIVIMAVVAGLIVSKQPFEASILGILMTVGILGMSGVYETGVDDVMVIDQAARQQGIWVKTSTWRQDVVATKPCRIELELIGEGRKARLVVTGTKKTATQEVLEQLCD